MKEWIPEKEFQKADFSFDEKEKVSKKQIQNDAKEKTNLNQKWKPWKPPTIEELRQEKKRKPEVKNKQTEGSNNQIKENEDTFLIRKASSTFLGEYLNRIIGDSPEVALRVLRKWYWEKTPASERKIFSVLKTLRKENLVLIFQFMTPLERKQMVEILKKIKGITSAEILAYHREFLNLMGQI